MGKKREPIQHSSTVGGCVSDAFSELQALGDEMRSWYDNMPENLQGGDKGSAVSEAADTLEGLSEPSVPDAVADVKVEWQSKPPTKRGLSRSARRDEATMMLDLAATAAQGWLDDPENETHEARDEVESFIDEVNSAKDDADNVEFPGMIG